MVCNIHCTASFFIWELFSVFLVSTAGSPPDNIPSLASANCRTMTFLRMVSPVVFDCLQPITSRLRRKLASTPTPCGMIENMSCATLERSADFECVSSCSGHQLAISSIRNVWLISIWSEWQSLRFGEFAPSSLVPQTGRSNSALPQSISMLGDRFVQVSFQPYYLVWSIFHHRLTNHTDQRMIELSLQPFQRGQDCCSVRIQIYWAAHVDVWHSIHSPHTSERPLSVE